VRNSPGIRLFHHAAGLLMALMTVSCVAHGRVEQRPYTAFKSPQRVEVVGYSGDAMEPFITRDGRYLLFNNRNDPAVDTNLYYAERIDDLHFRFRGEVRGANSTALDGVPSVSRDGTLVFISTRSYSATASTVYWAHFKNGVATGVELIPGVSKNLPGWVNFDAEISADGQSLIAVDSQFNSSHQPKSATLFLLRRHGRGFERLPDAEDPFKNINGDDLVYAPAESEDERELFFTKVHAITPDALPQIWRAARKSKLDPFGSPQPIAAISGFAEAPTISSDGHSLYYHRREGDRYVIYRVTR
jgi:hypothetical protein